jgi:hypothetical protein
VPLLGTLPETAGRGRPALVALNTNNHCTGIKSVIVVIADKAPRKSRHRVVRPTRKAVCFRIGQSTTVRYLNANPEVRTGCEAKIWAHGY